MADTDKPRLSDADMLARFKNSKKRPPCSDTLGMTLAEVEQDAMRIRMDFDVPEMFSNPTGAVQGGFISAMLDEAMSTCVIIASNVTMTAPTLEMKTSFLRRLHGSRVFRPGRRTGRQGDRDGDTDAVQAAGWKMTTRLRGGNGSRISQSCYPPSKQALREAGNGK